jgi:3-oxoacyl-[acyl-carrier protein] reductase
MLVARNKDKLEATAADVRSVGAEAKVYDLDLREPQAAEIVIKGTLERFGRIDALLNIAGAVPQIDAFEMTDAQVGSPYRQQYNHRHTTMHIAP